MRGNNQNRETTQWVGDQLHSIMGYSDRTTSSFIVALAAKARALGDLEQGLADAAIELNPATKAFAAQLFQRSRAAAAPRRGGGRSSTAVAAAASSSESVLRDRALAYDLVGDEEEEDADAAALRKLRRKKKKKKDKAERKRAAAAATSSTADPAVEDTAALQPRKRRRGGNRRAPTAAIVLDDDDDVDDDAPISMLRPSVTAAAARHAAAASADPTAAEKQQADEAQREADQLAKEEFEERLHARDDAKTRTLSGISAAKDSKALDASASSMTDEERQALIEKLRKESRYAYLTKREEKELKLLEWQIKDEEYLYEGQMHKLSAEEVRR